MRDSAYFRIYSAKLAIYSADSRTYSADSTHYSANPLFYVTFLGFRPALDCTLFMGCPLFVEGLIPPS
jgi:hypothetical protein